MALPTLHRKLFRNDGYGPLLKDEIVSKHISVQDWSNAYDYPVATVARGSDGVLYYSKLQSGPGTGAGAVDPTADDGTYWSSPALKTMPLGDKSAMGATTEWVKDLAVAPVYVDPAGDDANDGMSAATAVQTLAKAIEIAEAKPEAGRGIYIVVAAGSYTGDMQISGQRCLVELQGNVTLSGGVVVTNAGTVLVFDKSGMSNTISTGGIALSQSSHALFKNDVVVRTSSAFVNGVYCGNNSAISFDKTVDIYSSNASVVVYIDSGSRINVANAMNIYPNACGTGIFATNNSLFNVLSTGSVTLSNASGKCDTGILVAGNSSFVSYNVTINSVTNNYCVRVSSGSFCQFSGTNVLYMGGSSAESLIEVEQNSVVVFALNSSNTLTGAQGAKRVIELTYGSSVICTINVSLAVYLYTGTTAISCLSSMFSIYSGSLDLSGTATTCTVLASAGAIVNIRSAVTVNGSGMSGKRYYVTGNSTCYVDSAGPSRIPGSTPGSVDSSSYYG